MVETIASRIQELRSSNLKVLREKFRDLAGYEAPRWTHREALWRRVAWFLQAREHGGLSEETQQRLAELTAAPGMKLGPGPNEAPLAVAPPAARTKTFSLARRSDPRVPIPGTLLSRSYKGTEVRVTVLEDGFAFDGRIFRSLSSIAKEVTKTHLSGLAFFGLAKPRKKQETGGQS